MSDDKDITEKRVWNTMQVMRIVAFVAIAVFTLTMIYNRFLIMEATIETNAERENKRDKRSLDDRAAIWQVLNKMKDEHK